MMLSDDELEVIRVALETETGRKEELLATDPAHWDLLLKLEDRICDEINERNGGQESWPDA